MKAGKIALIASAVALPVAAAVAYFQYAKSAIEFSFNGIEFPNGISTGNLNIKLKLRIYSTIGFSFTIVDGTFNVFNGLNMVGTANQPMEIKVPNRVPVIYEIDAVVNPGVLGDSLFDYVAGAIGGNTNVNFQLKGISKIKVDVPLLSAFLINITVDENYSL